MNQTEDHNPGITDEGLFWTLLIAPEMASWRPFSARMCATDLWLPDMENLGNAIARGPMKPSTVQFDATWRGSGELEVARDEENQFEFRHRRAEGFVSFASTTQPGVSFRSIETSTPQETLFAAIGVERNGIFFEP
ncbi:MAG TPA: hypothetical protein VFT98_17545 [Myxococcota bacterium]|nr:hypothetical protein [Myxococcota bacterium]